MAATPTPEQKAAADAAAERKAADEKAETERKAAETAAVIAQAAAEPARLIVTGPAVVLGTADRSERYLYRGAVVARDAFTEESVQHNIELGLVAELIIE